MENCKKEQPTSPLQDLTPEQMRDITGGFFNASLGTLQFPDRMVGGCGTMVLTDRMFSILR